MKHGPIALLDEGSPVVVVATDSRVFDKLVSNIEEVRARGADVIAVASEGNSEIAELSADVILWVPRSDRDLAPMLAVVPLQLLAYHIARIKGLERRPAAQPGQDGDGGVNVEGVGIDALEVARMRRLLERLPAVRERLFTAQERDYCARFVNPYPRFAARFAAKEAVGKALGIGIIGFGWREIEVLSGGKPRVALHGRVARIAGELGVTRVELSLSHTDEQAYAVAAAIKEDT